MPDKTPLGRYLVARWTQLGITQAEFARRVSMFPAHVQQIKMGRRKPPLRAQLRWATALELHSPSDIDRLLELMQLGHALLVTQEAYERMR
jgi:transcriptional regulator with XRE-family HTH domain